MLLVWWLWWWSLSFISMSLLCFCCFHPTQLLFSSSQIFHFLVSVLKRRIRFQRKSRPPIAIQRRFRIIITFASRFPFESAEKARIFSRKFALCMQNVIFLLLFSVRTPWCHTTIHFFLFECCPVIFGFNSFRLSLCQSFSWVRCFSSAEVKQIKHGIGRKFVQCECCCSTRVSNSAFAMTFCLSSQLKPWFLANFTFIFCLWVFLLKLKEISEILQSPL